MVNHLLFALLFLISLYLSFAFGVNDPSPIQLLTSDKHYGPDGPWQAVTVSLGTQEAAVDLYPDSSYDSIILSKTICDGFKAYPCGSGGLYNPSLSSEFEDLSFEEVVASDKAWVLGALKYRGSRTISRDLLNLLHISLNGPVWVSNLSLLLVKDVSMIYPDGSNYPIQLGNLALGGAFPNATYGAINASLLPGSLLEQNLISSSSFGMHLGSATLGPRLSLWLGGYDRSRIVGPVSIQVISYLGPAIDLLDIGIGVDHGASPFPFVSREGFLAEGNLSIGQSIPLVMNPSAPYLAVPSSTCAAIAKSLPVTYNPKYGLYFWNVNDRLYNQIVTSPSYLSFIFRAQGLDTANITIKVPFRLLDLTLDAPLVATPIQYFPCQPPQDWVYGSVGWSLGRAFLQAAYFGINWSDGPGKWYLAQAAGPNTALAPNQSPLSPHSTLVVSSSGATWSDSWSGHWSPLPDDPPQLNHTSSIQAAGKDSLKTWKIAVIIIGSIVGLSLLGFLTYKCCYHRDPNSETPPLTEEVLSSTSGQLLANMPNFTITELPDHHILELPHTHFSEMPNSRERAELGNVMG